MILFSCNNKNYSNDKNKELKNTGVNNQSTVRLEIENNLKYLKNGETTKISLIGKDFSDRPSKLSAIGGEIDFKNVKVTQDKWEFLITPNKKGLLNKQIIIEVIEKSNAENIKKFHIKVIE